MLTESDRAAIQIMATATDKVVADLISPNFERFRAVKLLHHAIRHLAYPDRDVYPKLRRAERKEISLSVPGKPEMTYGEFNQRRAHIQKLIRTAARTYKTATDPRYTPLTKDGASIAYRALQDAEGQLSQLIADWETIQRNRGVKP